jgi:hypothetical protein
VSDGRVLELVDLDDQKLFPAHVGDKQGSLLSETLEDESWQTAQDGKLLLVNMSCLLS